MALRSKGPAGLLRRWFAEGPLKRIFRNAGLLLTGKGAGGLLSLAYLALAARALGAESFGVLVLVHSFALTVGTFVHFKAWQAIIRYGSLALERERPADFQRMVSFGIALELASGLVGAAAAAALAAPAAPWLGWPPGAVGLAAAYAVAVVFMVHTTPIGLLRLFNRFDLLSLHQTVNPATRLAGAGLAYALGGGLGAFVAVWLVSAVAESLAAWALAARELARRGLLAGLVRSPAGIVRAHPELWRYLWSTNLNGTVTLLAERVSPLAVGWILGPAPAGMFHVARRVATVLAQPAQMLRQSVYPEIARLAAQDELKAVRRTVLRAGAVAALAGLPVLLVLAALGRPILGLVGGEAFAAAYGVLVLLATGRVVQLLGFPLGDALVALGRPGLALWANGTATLLFIPTLVALLAWLGLIGAGLNAIAYAVVSVALMAAVMLHTLSRRGRARLRGHAAGAQPAAAGGLASGSRKRARKG